MRSIVLDTQALLVFYLGEAGSGRVESYLEQISRGEAKGFLNIVNLAEFHYVLRRISKTTAEEKERNLRSFGVKIVPVTDNSPLWREAAAIKADNALSLADSFAASTALLHRGTLVTGSDVEFDRVKDLKVERVGS
ncbi:MAG: type II toxin-antitoxin system VapC family toxin [Nitrososphaerota archaeon]|nr:type II toxin-antitoxin system VapC family toxin [Nitrososphaerota archaeon]